MTRRRSHFVGHVHRGGKTPHLASLLLILVVALFDLVAGRAEAAKLLTGQSVCEPGQTLRWRGGTARLENDLFAGSDRNYTSGVGLSMVSYDIEGRLRTDCLPWPLGAYARFLGWVNPGFWRNAGAESATQNLVVRVGQAIYTPEDESRSDLIRNDRPYAGLLYLGLAWNRRVHPQNAEYEMLDTRELALGVIGPWSMAEQSQNLVHDLRNFDRFEGWDHQLRNEPALQLVRERKFKPYAAGAIKPGWSSDVVGSYALRLGNIETAASIGSELRGGWNLPNDFGSYPIRPGGENRPPSAATEQRSKGSQATAPQPGAHVFINLEAKAVAWDFSLDGNLFRSSHHVSRRPWVVQAAMGISSQWLVAGHGMRLAVMRVWRTHEFEEQAGRHAFASIALSWEF